MMDMIERYRNLDFEVSASDYANYEQQWVDLLLTKFVLYPPFH